MGGSQFGAPSLILADFRRFQEFVFPETKKPRSGVRGRSGAIGVALASG
jgi:hypothetical protein